MQGVLDLLSLSLSCERASWQVHQTCKPTNSGVQDVCASEETLPLSFVHTLACSLRPAPDAATRVARREKRAVGMHLIGTLVLLLKGAIYFETRKHCLVVKCTQSSILFLTRKSGNRVDVPASPRDWTGPSETDTMTYSVKKEHVR